MTQAPAKIVAVKLAPVVFLALAAGFWFNHVQDGGPFVLRNLLPLALVVVLAALSLRLGSGRWGGAGWRLPLGVLGFSIPAVGLSVYLHYAYSVNLNGMFTGAADPRQLFRFLPAYTLVAGAIGFAIGWIVGRNV